MNISRLISLKFIFNPGIGSLSQAFALVFYIIFGLLIILAIVAFLKSQKYKKSKNNLYLKLWQKIFDFGFYLGIVGFLLLFFRQQNIYFLSMPFLTYALFVWLIIWAYRIFKFKNKRIKEIQKNNLERESKKRYL